MAATKTGYDYISACRQDGSEIQTTISMISGSSYTMSIYNEINGNVVR